ncbi:hypothetical protein GWK48_04145 [Metallosphaera tengchongensis]|uniref:Uncharacterized protein n=1 Tax=Metallosphaera tengchongensis TaxID=1532350 RepID=A0A6N0NWF9_9CREN|nr:hypothetical protein [Metallosphaera tengchongensis]QKQ99687.1 hypothetical protein GWK48_04145 [Metallosphaera tengchongensis]
MVSYLLLAGVILLVVGLSLYVLIPTYFSGYQTINNVFRANQGYVNLPPLGSQIVKNFTVHASGQAIIFLVTKGNANVTLLNDRGQPILNQEKQVSIALNQSSYSIEIINLNNATQNITYTYGLFNAESISNFYYSLGVLETFLDLLIVIGLGLILWYVLSLIVSRRKPRN